MFMVPDYDISDGLISFESALRCIDFTGPENATFPSAETLTTTVSRSPFNVGTVAEFLHLHAASPRALSLLLTPLLGQEGVLQLVHRLSSLMLSARPITALQLGEGVSPTLNSKKRPREEECDAPLLLQTNCLSTGCSEMDRFLNGGFLRGSLIEVAGPAGAGKTQIVLQALLECAARRICDRDPSIPVRPSCVFLVAEDMPGGRLVEIARAVAAHHQLSEPLDILNAVLIRKVHHRDDFLRAVTYVEGLCLNRLAEENEASTIDLIVVDSITAALEEDEKEKDTNLVTSGHVSRAGSALRKLAALSNAAVVCTNQVRSSFAQFESRPQNEFVPALGLAWSTSINTRIMLRAHRENEGTTRRTANLIFASHIPERTIPFQITSNGVENA